MSRKKVAEAGGGEGPASRAGGTAVIQARLSLLEENFARLCTVVGSLEMEIRLLRETAAAPCAREGSLAPRAGE
ncbi:MAG: hypothetical protein LBO77_03980 [Desulfovibrio sp.]|jgi:hypothetical protein|nr:hypothetical protein [Desulfovibrio sp.]